MRRRVHALARKNPRAVPPMRRRVVPESRRKRRRFLVRCREREPQRWVTTRVSFSVILSEASLRAESKDLARYFFAARLWRNCWTTRPHRGRPRDPSLRQPPLRMTKKGGAPEQDDGKGWDFRRLSVPRPSPGEGGAERQVRVVSGKMADLTMCFVAKGMRRSEKLQRRNSSPRSLSRASHPAKRTSPGPASARPLPT